MLRARAEADGPDAATCHGLIGRWEAHRKNPAAAIAALRQGGAALEAPSPATPDWAPAELVDLLVATKDVATAHRVARAALADGRDTPELRLALAGALLAGVEADDLRERLGDAILLRPMDRLLVERVLDRLASTAPADALLDWLEALQDTAPEPQRALLLTLLGRRGDAHVRARFAPLLGRAAGRPDMASLDRLWTAWIAGRPLPAEDLAIAQGAHPVTAELYFRLVAPAPRNVALFGRVAEQDLAPFGVATEALRRFALDFLQPGTEAWRERLATALRLPGPDRRVVAKAERECGYIDRIVATATLSMADPLSGEPVPCADSFIAFGRSIYVFRGLETFVLICSGPWASAIGLHLPRLGLSITFGPSANAALGGEQLANVLVQLLRRAIRHAASPPAPSPRPGPVLFVPATENFAHHLWNFYSAIERLAVTGLIDRLSRVIFFGTEFFGPLEELFPELARIGVERPPKNNVSDPAPLDPRSIVVRSGGYWIPASLSRRVIAAMQRRPRAIPDAVEPADIARDAAAPVVWIGMRMQDKAWAEQETGILHIITRLRAAHPGTTILLDGYSYPVGIDNISHQWEPVIAGLRAIGERIRAAAGPASPVVNMVGNSLRESVLWAREVDVYLAPFGTTQHKVGWFTDAPGIVYVPPGIGLVKAARSPGAIAAEISTIPHFILGEPASAGERRGLNRNRERQVNMSLDPDRLADLLLQQLAARRARSPGS
ncbi:hypothetical protein [Muricoccus radiodurans]|uniref:hypothetical protein n=1 Tax=Muricoccus radiodurans TaxID=2231721 RepID=UPI003CF41D25